MGRILLLSVDRSLADRIATAMGSRASVDLIQSLDAERLAGPSVIVIDRLSIPPERSLAAAINTVAESAAGRPIVLATDDREADQLLSAVRAGANDIIPRAGEGPETGTVLSRLLTSAIADQASHGRLTLVLGVDQEAAAMVATDMAIAASPGRASTLLIDCTLPTSAAQAYLDIPVNYGLASAVADIERLDASLLSSALARHDQSGVMLLTFDGGSGAEPVGLSPTDIGALVRMLRACCSDVVLHPGSLRHGGLLRDLATQADQVELLCAQSIRDLEATRRLLDRIGPDSAMTDRMRLIVWDHQPGVLLDGRRMADALGLDHVLGLPVDGVRSRNALNAGRPLALEGDGGAYMQAIRRAVGGTAGPARGIDRLRHAMLRVVERRA